MDRILVVEDEEKISRVIRAYLEKEGFAVEEASDGLQALELVSDFNFSLIILDLMLPHMSGEDVCKQLRRQGNNIPIIMLTAKGAEEERIRGLGLGADDYIVKPFSPGELVARVHAVLRRYRSNNGVLAEVMEFADGDLVIDTLRRQATLRGQLVDLTATEFKLLAAMAKSPGRVFTRGELLEIAQGALPTGFDRTIDSHIKNLRQKLEPKPDEPQLIRTVYGVGYKFTGD
ncbi:response regulator transcription factor [Dethiobacter alkaliphilus]|uniref:Two component transcriptional regulator, winged helix family n=1 Tax=Dethiobacter alkaliphilus AHT 1 TaxID=555088 RepID=C0GC97_DETAL|nr:response regulator transcription factor [Dethiobacter alkaliphilus]EEG78832.1 two component transcriptional regulator, winged helix family [Dethiobacter alkaliphilus AHT 1]